jgi:hypothetical protein
MGRRFARLGTLIAVLLLAAAPAGAAVITSVTGNASTSVTTQGGPGADDYYAGAGFFDDCGAGCSAFTGLLGANAGIAADPGENIRIDVEWSFTIDIVVDAGATEAWELAGDTALAGYLTTIDQGSGRSRGRVSDLAGTLDTAGLTLTGSMNLLGGRVRAADGQHDLHTGWPASQPVRRPGMRPAG